MNYVERNPNNFRAFLTISSSRRGRGGGATFSAPLLRHRSTFGENKDSKTRNDEKTKRTASDLTNQVGEMAEQSSNAGSRYSKGQDICAKHCRARFGEVLQASRGEDDD